MTELSTKTDWTAIGEAGLAEVVELRRAIHADPEIGLQCPRTTQKLKKALEGLPLEIHEGTSTTGFMAVLRGGSDNGRTVLLRGDMDALPMQEETGLDYASKVDGAMHACGHDAHSAMLVGAAKALCAKRDELPGTVVFMFQPGEEGHHGARFMIEDGLLEKTAPDAGFALHIYPNAPRGMFVSRPGPLLASADTLNATIRGKGGHGAMPHDCIDPIPVACEIVTALQTWVARRVPVSDPAVLTISKIAAGSTHNVIPSSCELLGTLRTLSEETRAKVQQAFKDIVHHVAAAHGCEGEATIEVGYPVTMNDERATGMMEEIARDIGGEQGWMKMPAPIMGAEDFSYVLRELPGAMAFLGVAPEGSDPESNPPLHNTKMTIDEDMLSRGVAMHCAIAERYLERGFD
ncbi:M20 metallopeptidase family protein [Stakelama marina]|uniref:Amidohydrolase n=1 Tax=Stakelama marina TaxID=2826939 RepID=A0A8T4IHW6_9SPHN|nr:M20 family metallopeptidase [Stakelama marina]MBR0553632.1 amidohydrolase [Stakelama marina]